MPGKGTTSKFMRRCVADVTAQGKETDTAFAICTKQSQKAGYTEPGTRTMTGKGKKREKQLAQKKDMPAKQAAFEKAIKKEDQATILGLIEAVEAL